MRKSRRRVADGTLLNESENAPDIRHLRFHALVRLIID